MYTHQGPRLYLANDRRTVVPEGDVRAAFLLIADGQTMSDEAALAYGLIAGESEPAKAAQPKPIKARTPRENKGA